jgi:hypothetical protein
VAAAAHALALEPADLLVVFDDLDLPLGGVRARRAGSSGGHHGVQSILAALGTSEVRRVKVGIGRPLAPGEPRAQVVDHVLSRFTPEEGAAIAEACDAAAARVLELLARRRAIAGPGGAWYTVSVCDEQSAIALWCSRVDSTRRTVVTSIAIEPAAPVESALPWPTASGAAAVLELPGDARTRTSFAAHGKAERRERTTD